ncbi:MAG: lytic transglycosylase domain-containing protein [Clostridia bacterium]|nr:lytic transglycosylase domain-containing protein [Clostridia bacterium]
MRNIRKSRNGSGLGTAVLIILVISIVFGFAFDFILTKIEYSIYPKPDEYAKHVSKYSAEYGVPEDLIWAVIKTESDFDSSAESGAGAVGLMQLMPTTFDEITNQRLKDGFDIGMRYDPETNIRYGTYYLSYLYARYGNWDTALAAYNGGLGNVDSWLADPDFGNAESGVLYKIPYKETANYVKKVNKALKMYEKLYEGE